MTLSSERPNSEFDLLDYRRRVAQMYAGARDGQGDVEARWREFRGAREELFRSHPQSALSEAQKKDFRGLDYFPYDPGWRILAEVDRDVEGEIIEVPLQQDGLFRMQRMGRVEFDVAGQSIVLYLYWVPGYGGGLFLPFRDATGQSGETYGGGRYLLDSLKGADLGMQDGKLVLDFNFAYNPSCAYHPRWHCPLPPQENWLAARIGAGEKAFLGEGNTYSP